MIIKIDIRPISVNAFWGQHGSRKYISAKGREWREYIQYHLTSLLNKKKIKSFGAEKPLILNADFHFKGKRERDWDNYLKPLQDSLQGFLFDDDKQILGTDRVRRYYEATHDYVVIEILKTTESEKSS